MVLKRYTMVLEKENKEKLQQIAEADERSLSFMIRKAVQNLIEECENGTTS